MSLATPDSIRKLQRKLYLKAKDEPSFRFYLLYDKICREDILCHAHDLARAGAGRQTLVAPRPELVGVDAELGRHLLQGLAALLEPLDRLGLVLGGEPPPLALLRHRPLPVLVEPTLRRCPSSQGRLRRR